MHNINKVLQIAYNTLNKKNIKSAHLDAELLLSFILSSQGGQAKSREYILAHPEKKLTKKQIIKFNDLIKQRSKHVPVAYLIKEKEFYGRTFYVDERVLVPRPETEMIIADCRLQIADCRLNNIAIIDIGTGSGCIVITLAKELQNLKPKIKNKKFLATDISKDALTVARKNARLHKVDKKIKFLHGNLLKPVYKLLPANCKLIITANLPYLTPVQIKNSPSIKHEPKLALMAGKDGLKYYRELAKQVKKLIKINPKLNIAILCEINPKQLRGMKKIFSFAEEITIKKDLAGLDRVAIIKV